MNKLDKLVKAIEYLMIVIIVALCIGIAVPEYQKVKNEYDARFILEQSKLIRLACHTKQLEYYAKDDTILDLTKESNVKDEVYNAIKEFLQADADFIVQDIDEHNEITKIIIIFDNYITVYDNSTYTVSKLQNIIE